jgi:hypothetical protein
MAMGQTIMSHLHHIDGLSTAAAQYQAYLERMRVAHSEEEDEKKVRRKNEGKKFQEHLEPDDEEPEGNPGESPEENAPEDGQEETGQETSPGNGFGNHYA